MLGEALLNTGAITQAQLDQALAQQRTSGVLLGEILLSLNFITEETLARALAREAGVPFVVVDGMKADPAAVALVPEPFARKHMLAPLAVKGASLEVLQANPFDVLALDQLRSSRGPADHRLVRDDGRREESARAVLHRSQRSRFAGSGRRGCARRAGHARRDRGFTGRASAGNRHQRCDRQGRDRSARRAGGSVPADPLSRGRRPDSRRHDSEGTARAAGEPHEGARRHGHHRAAHAAGRPHLADGQRAPRRSPRGDVSDDLRREGGDPHPRERQTGERTDRAGIQQEESGAVSRHPQQVARHRPGDRADRAQARRRRCTRRWRIWAAPSETS